MDRPFTMIDSVEDSVARLVIAGDVDLAVLSPIREAVTRCLADEACTALTMDLSGVTFIDSSGLGVLVASRREAREAAKRFQVTGATGRTADIIEATGLTEYLTGS